MTPEKRKPTLTNEIDHAQRVRTITQYCEMERLIPTPDVLLCDPQTTLTVVVPAYNEEDFIGDTLLSLGASNTPIEIVVVDNGSEDRTKDVALETAKQLPYSVTILTCDKRGPVNARKRGMDEVLAHYLYKTSATNPRYMAMTDSDTQVPENWADTIYHTLTTTHAAAGGGLFYFPSVLDELIESRTGIKDYFKLIPTVAHYLASNDASLILTYGANSAIEVAAYALIGGSQQPTGSDGKPIKGSDLRFGDAVRNSGQLVSFLPIFSTTSARREIFALSQKTPQYILSSMEGWVDSREKDVLLLEKIIDSLQVEDFLRHRGERLVSFVYRNVIFPILTDQIDIGEIEKLIGAEDDFVLALNVAKNQIAGMSSDEIRQFSRALGKTYASGFIKQIEEIINA